MMSDITVVFGYLLLYFEQYGMDIPIKLSVSKYPHLLLTGSSGSGKSKALLFLIGKLLQNCTDIMIFVCDFKNSEDFSFLRTYEHYYCGNDCYRGIMEYYALFTKAREKGGKQFKRYLLICDEYPAFVNYLQLKDKANKTRYATDILNCISEILMLGRGIGFGLWIVTQRADSTLFSGGARDNFMVVIAMGRLSKEQKTMLFSGEDIPERTMSVGEGLMLADGKEIVLVKYPIIKNENVWKKHIGELIGTKIE